VDLGSELYLPAAQNRQLRVIKGKPLIAVGKHGNCSDAEKAYKGNRYKLQLRI